MKKNRFWLVGVAVGVLAAAACGGAPVDNGDGDGDLTGDGDGDVVGDGDGTGDGDGDVAGDGDVTGDGDGDVAGDGDVTGDGDGDVVGDGDIVGDGDGDIVGDGDGDIVGDGDGDTVSCTDNLVWGLSVVAVGGAYPPPPELGEDQDVPEDEAPPLRPEQLVPPDEDLIPVPIQECEVTVIAVDGDYSEELECYPGFPTDVDCTCSGASERVGSYTVTATWGHLSETQQVTVTADECHVVSQRLTFFGE